MLTLDQHQEITKTEGANQLLQAIAVTQDRGDGGGGGGVALPQGTEAIAEPQGHQKQGLLGQTQGGEAVAIALPFQGGEIDMGGDVLLAQVTVGIVVVTMLVVALQGTLVTTGAMVAAGGVAVVNGEDVASPQLAGQGCQLSLIHI